MQRLEVKKLKEWNSLWTKQTTTQHYRSSIDTFSVSILEKTDELLCKRLEELSWCAGTQGMNEW